MIFFSVIEWIQKYKEYMMLLQHYSPSLRPDLILNVCSKSYCSQTSFLKTYFKMTGPLPRLYVFSHQIYLISSMCEGQNRT